MPTYGYQCTQCSNAFETVQKISDAPLTTCQVCGGPLRKKIFPVGIAFKGSGFYVNDYAKKSADPAPAATAAATPTPADTAAPTAAGSDAPAAPAASTTPAPTPTAAPATAAASGS